MKNEIRFGLIVMLLWNALLAILVGISATVRNVSPDYYFDDGTGGIATVIFLLLWSAIWFGIGCHVRKDYVRRKTEYRLTFPDVETKRFDKEFRLHYFSKHAKMFAILSGTAVPWYVIGYVRPPIENHDLAIIIALMLLSACSFGFYKAKNAR